MPSSASVIRPVRLRANRLGHIGMARYFWPACLISLLIHSSFLWFMSPEESSPLPLPIEVSIVSPSELKGEAKQIVAPSEAKESEQEPARGFESERNAVAEKEVIKRGMPDAGEVVGEEKRVQQPPAQQHQTTNAQPTHKSQPRSEEPAPKIKSLTLDSSSSLQKFGLQPQKPITDEELSKSISGQGDVPSNYRPFSRPLSSGARFLGRAGSADFLPNLPDGDITMLNEKASKFAGFVRRVATQVFGQLRLEGWDNLSPADIMSINDFSTIRVVMSLKGEIQKVSVDGQSGSARFDDVVLRSAKKGARDPNPPPQAVAEDGTIHFIFQARSWVAAGNNPRNGAPLQRRWLLLGTGLE